MRNKKLLSLLVAPVFAVGLAACEVEQTREGEAPEFEVEEGRAPAYEVEPAEIEVTEDTVTVPDVDVRDPEDDPYQDDGLN